MKITRKLVRVGDSKAIIIPKEWLETKPGLTHLTLDLEDKKITISIKEVEDARINIGSENHGTQ